MDFKIIKCIEKSCKMNMKSSILGYHEIRSLLQVPGGVVDHADLALHLVLLNHLDGSLQINEMESMRLS